METICNIIDTRLWTSCNDNKQYPAPQKIYSDGNSQRREHFAYYPNCLGIFRIPCQRQNAFCLSQKYVSHWSMTEETMQNYDFMVKLKRKIYSVFLILSLVQYCSHQSAGCYYGFITDGLFDKAVYKTQLYFDGYTVR